MAIYADSFSGLESAQQNFSNAVNNRLAQMIAEDERRKQQLFQNNLAARQFAYGVQVDAANRAEREAEAKARLDNSNAYLKLYRDQLKGKEETAKAPTAAEKAFYRKNAQDDALTGRFDPKLYAGILEPNEIAIASALNQDTVNQMARNFDLSEKGARVLNEQQIAAGLAKMTPNTPPAWYKPWTWGSGVEPNENAVALAKARSATLDAQARSVSPELRQTMIQDPSTRRWVTTMTPPPMVTQTEAQPRASLRDAYGPAVITSPGVNFRLPTPNLDGMQFLRSEDVRNQVGSALDNRQAAGANQQMNLAREVAADFLSKRTQLVGSPAGSGIPDQVVPVPFNQNEVEDVALQIVTGTADPELSASFANYLSQRMTQVPGATYNPLTRAFEATVNAPSSGDRVRLGGGLQREAMASGIESILGNATRVADAMTRNTQAVSRTKQALNQAEAMKPVYSISPNANGAVRVQLSNGNIGTIPATNLPALFRRDPGAQVLQ